MPQGPPGPDDAPGAPRALLPSSPAAPVAVHEGPGPLDERQLRALSSSAIQHTGGYQRALLLAFLVGGAALPFGASPGGFVAIAAAVGLGVMAKQVYRRLFVQDAESLGIERAKARRLFELALLTRRRLGQRPLDLEQIEDGVERALLETVRPR